MQTLEHAGCTLSYRVVGNGPPVLLIQGVGVHGDGWRPQTDLLAERFTCLSFDNRGLLRSQPLGAGRLSVELMAQDGLALADAQGWERFHIVGHSMGGHIALALALAAPRRVRSLALLCTSARGKDMPPVTPSFLWTSLRSRVGPRRGRRHAFLEMVLPREIREVEDKDEWSQRLERIFGHDLADTPSVVMKQVRAYRDFDASPRLGELGGIPSLVVSASEDPLGPPALGRALAGGILGAQFREIHGASHGVTVTHAEDINGMLARHMAE